MPLGTWFLWGLNSGPFAYKAGVKTATLWKHTAGNSGNMNFIFTYSIHSYAVYMSRLYWGLKLWTLARTVKYEPPIPIGTYTQNKSNQQHISAWKAAESRSLSQVQDHALCISAPFLCPSVSDTRPTLRSSYAQVEKQNKQGFHRGPFHTGAI